jgi:dTDP-4-dehydrorhamnose reductase
MREREMISAMRVLVTGAGGLVGGSLAVRLAASHAVVAAEHTTPAPPGLDRVPLDLEDPASIERAIAAARPDAVIHAAAMADADACERDPARARRLNVDASAALAAACRRGGIRIVALSTDLVFAGDREAVGEEDAARPILAYGHAKLLGEEAVLREAPGAAVLRVALVSGRGHGARGSATESIAWALRSGRSVRLFTDQFRTPVDTHSVADAIDRVLRRGAAGRFHIGGPERLSRHALGLRVAAVLGLDAGRIEPVRQADQPIGFPRPADVSLDSCRAQRELDWRPVSLEDAIRAGRPGPE